MLLAVIVITNCYLN